MRTTTSRAAALAVVGTALVAGAPLAPAGAVEQTTPVATTYDGTWYEGTAEDCTQTSDVSGRWSVTIKKDGTANISLALHTAGKLHAAWGGNAFGERATWEQTPTGYVLSLFDFTFTIAGDQVTFYIPDRYPGCDAYVRGTVG